MINKVSIKIKIIISGFLWLLWLISSNLSAKDGDTLTIAFWNVENLFDLADDPYKNDDEFALGGVKNVTQDIYDLKLRHCAEVLDDLSADILGLCEVENRFVLEELNRVYEGHDYGIVHHDSPDSRGIDVALYYNPEVVKILESRPVQVIFSSGRPTRDILYVLANFGGQDLHIFVNHWPSNYSGLAQAIPRRARAAVVLRGAVEKILKKDPGAEIILMGDFNEDPDHQNVKKVLGSTLNRQKLGKNGSILVNLMSPIMDVKNGGTYKYKGEDSVIDQFIVSPGLFDTNGLKFISGSVAVNDKPGYRQTGKWEGYPFRFWVRTRLLGGYSDHMSVYMKIVTTE